MTTVGRAIAILKSNAAPRVISRNAIEELLRTGGIEVSSSSYRRLVAELVESGCLRPVNRRLYLNREASPPAGPDEAARHLEPGAIISLQRVLGMHGVLNNPSGYVTAVVPTSPGHSPPTLGPRQTEAGVFVFRGIPEQVLYAGDQYDRLDLISPPIPGGIPIATPEKALLDWIYLGASGRSNLPLPPIHDIDIDMLDRDRLDRLAAAAGPRVAEEVAAWMDLADLHEEHEDDSWMDGPSP